MPTGTLQPALPAAAEARLRKSLLGAALHLRQRAASERANVPRFVSYDQVRLSNGTILGRKKVILMSGGCSVPTCTMCPFTNENNYGAERTYETLLEQVGTVLVRRDNEPAYSVLALYNDGSFFAPREVSEEIQLAIAERVATSGVAHLIVESLPQFITAKSIGPFVERLGSVTLEIGVGLQSSDDLVRETLVNTRITRPIFERAIATMRQYGVVPKVYLMIKPPFLTDGEAITDVVQSVSYVRSLGIDGVTLCPTRLSRNTVAWQLYQNGVYQPPNLWTVVEATRRAKESSEVRVACINLRGTDFDSVFPDSCPNCADSIVDALILFGETGDPMNLPVSCSCRPATVAEPLDRDTILRRALSTLDANPLQQPT
jgi:radical SAM enzyme (TIGR01210 family)